MVDSKIKSETSLTTSLVRFNQLLSWLELANIISRPRSRENRDKVIKDINGQSLSFNDRVTTQ